MAVRKVKNDPKVALELFLYFFKIGWFTFGGGFSIIAQLQKDYIDKKHIESEEALLDQTSIGRSLPGLMVTNVCYLFAYSVGGALAGVAAVAGLMLPPIIMITIVTTCYGAFRDNTYVARALAGVRSAVVPIIGSAAMRLRKGAFTHGIISYLMCAAALAVVLLLRPNIVFIIIAAAVIGVALSEYKARRELKE